ncbi:MAG: His-Xaa-Ser system protein HxsD [bacterium]|nr:His-Xaa-Ser system protein HxsD [bacterium]
MKIKVNENVFSKENVIKASFEFIDDYYIEIDKENEYFIISISAKEKNNNISIESEFRNELVNQNVREKISKETSNVRELILTRALYSTYFEETEDEISEEETKEFSINDIARDWFEHE